MAEELIDGTGSGNRAKVRNNKLDTYSVIEPEEKYANRKGKQWSLSFTTTPVGAGDYFFYIKNIGEPTLSITDIRSMCAGVDTIECYTVSGTPTYTASSDITPVAKNLGSSKTPLATIKKDTDITGLSENGKIYFQRLDTADKGYKLSASANIIIPQGHSLALKAITGTNAIDCTVSLVEIDE
jgi:hypothetical protein|tara:strand:+ start:2052 stop:2600 length:549 start_codon:yes stop_codon:yes gene_type:complete